MDLSIEAKKYFEVIRTKAKMEQLGSPFLQFLDLIELDQKIEKYLKEIDTVNHEIAKAQSEKRTLQNNVADKELTVLNARKTVDAQELDMKSLDELEKSYKSRLDAISNQKEYHSLKTEIDRIKKKQHDLEESLLTAWHLLEMRTKELNEQKKVVDANLVQLDSTIEQASKKIAQSTQEMEELSEQRIEKEKNVPQEWLEKYVLMRARVPNPVVPVEQGSCSACFYKIPEQDMMLLRRKKLVQCKDCYRLLYLPDRNEQ